MIVILLGPPGVGKGTQASLAAASNGWTHLSTGELLRDEVAQGSDLGMQADEFMSRGDLVPDELMVEMVAGRIAGIQGDDVLLLDGFPRTLQQAESLAAKAPSGAVRLALYFTAPDSVLTARLMGRGRADDTEEVIAHRLTVYRETTAPLERYYREQGLLVEVNSDRDIPEIQSDMARVVQSALAGSL
jgi:adenylate kinase